MSLEEIRKCARISSKSATAKQRSFLRRLDNTSPIDVEKSCQDRWGVTIDELCSREASQLIDDTLRAMDYIKRFPGEVDE